LIIVPKTGITLDHFRVAGFQEKGDALNVNISAKKGHKITANFGLGLKKHVTVKSFDIIPGVHFNIDRILLGDNDSATITTIEPNPRILTTKLPKEEKTTYMIGTVINMRRSESFDFGVGYDYSFRPNFYNHSGYVSLSIKF
jgi:hypothetical protein